MRANASDGANHSACRPPQLGRRTHSEPEVATTSAGSSTTAETGDGRIVTTRCTLPPERYPAFGRNLPLR